MRVLTLKCWGIFSKRKAGPTESIGNRQNRHAGRGVDPKRRRANGGDVSRALKSQKLWLSLTYLGLILLMARTYA